MSSKKKPKKPQAQRLQAKRPSSTTRKLPTKPAAPVEQVATPSAASVTKAALLLDIQNRRFPDSALPKLFALMPEQQAQLKTECGENYRKVRQDLVKAPKYNRGGIECIDSAEAMVTDWPPQTAYRLGQVYQYLYRHRHGGNPLRDLLKARTLLDREIEAVEREANAAVLETYTPIPF